MCSRSSSVRDLQTSKGKMRVIRISSFRHQKSTFIPRKVNKQIFSYPPPPPLPFVVRHYYLCTHIRGLYSPPPPSSSFSTYPRPKLPSSSPLSFLIIPSEKTVAEEGREEGGGGFILPHSHLWIGPLTLLEKGSWEHGAAGEGFDDKPWESKFRLCHFSISNR